MFQKHSETYKYDSTSDHEMFNKKFNEIERSIKMSQIEQKKKTLMTKKKMFEKLQKQIAKQERALEELESGLSPP